MQAEVRLVSPRAETPLAGGSITTIEWTADAPLPAHVEEWEAFLSVDGGRYYAVRITPHLGREMQRFTFAVPNVAANDVRILLRFGDEKREQEIELPARFSIRPDPTLWQRPAIVTRDAGEPARPGARGVVAWVSGERDGSARREVVQRTPSCSAPAVFAAVHVRGDGAETSEATVVGVPDGCALVFGRPRAASRIALLQASDRLLLTARLNI